MEDIDVVVHFQQQPPEIRRAVVQRIAHVLWPDETLIEMEVNGAPHPAKVERSDAPPSEGQDDNIVAE